MNSSILRDNNMSSLTKEEVDLIKEQLNNLVTENKILKDQCQHINSQLDIALLQVSNINFNELNSNIKYLMYVL